MQVAQMISIHNTAKCQVTHCVVMKQIVECSPLQEGSHKQQVPRVRVHRGAHHCHNVGMPQPKSYQCFLDHLHKVGITLFTSRASKLASILTLDSYHTMGCRNARACHMVWMIMGCQCSSRRKKKFCTAKPPMRARNHYNVAQDTQLHS